MSKIESSGKVKLIDKNETVNKKMGNLLLDNCSEIYLSTDENGQAYLYLFG